MIPNMSPDEYLNGVADRLRADGASVTHEQFGGVDAFVGYRSQFRLRWMATKLNLFTVVVSQPSITADGLQQYAKDVLDFANSQKGRFRGLQNGVAAIPVQVGSEIETGAIAFAESKIVKRFAAFAWPAVVDLSTGGVHRHQGRVALGAVYASWMRQQTDLALKG